MAESAKHGIAEMPWKELPEPSPAEVRKLRNDFRRKARFLVDESAGIGVAEYMRSLGYNVKFVTDLQLTGRSDEDVFAAAWTENRVIVSHDADFLDNRRFPPHRNPGVVVIRPGADGRDTNGLIACLVKAILLAGKNAAWFRGKKLEFRSDEALTITSARTRSRYLWRKNGMPLEWQG